MQSLSNEGTIGFDLVRLTAKQALGLAKGISGKTNEEIAEDVGQDYSSVKRYFLESDSGYYPSLMRLPRLCEALGNTVLIDWLQAQLDENPHPGGIDSENDLLRRMGHLSSELGRVHQAVEEALDGPGTDIFSAKRLFSGLIELEMKVRDLRRSMQQASGRHIDSEGWRTAMARGDS
ncbi:MAG: hypothetical protein ACLFQG_01265 [Desulfovermiculus sp.]